MFTSDTRAARICQVALSLFIGLLIWEIAGWQFNAAHMAPALGSDVGITRWIAELIAGGAKMEEHPGTFPRLIDFIQEGEFFIALGQSLSLFGTGFGIALAIGLPLGILMARVRLLRVGLESYILGLYATPMAALIPFILAIFGFQFWPKVIVVVLFSVFPILYNTLEGARSLKPEMIEVARAFRSSEYRIWIDILIPYTLPFALTGIRQAIGRADEDGRPSDGAALFARLALVVGALAGHAALVGCRTILDGAAADASNVALLGHRAVAKQLVGHAQQ